jgi:hypothetical protein
MMNSLRSPDEVSVIKREELTTACTTLLQTRVWFPLSAAFTDEIAGFCHLKKGPKQKRYLILGGNSIYV